VDPHYFDVDPDLACHFDADADPDPTFHFDPDPGPDPSFQIKAQIGSYSIHFGCKLQIGADPDSDPADHLMRIRIRLITLMRSRILPFKKFDADPQHWFMGCTLTVPTTVFSLNHNAWPAQCTWNKGDLPGIRAVLYLKTGPTYRYLQSRLVTTWNQGRPLPGIRAGLYLELGLDPTWK
jgi:hypothetical protein